MALHLKAAFGATDTGQFAIDEDPGVRFGDNLGGPAQMGLAPLQQWPGVAAISEQMRETWETPCQVVQQQGSAKTIH